jgi:hypothetical protein
MDCIQEVVVKTFVPTYVTEICRRIGDDDHSLPKLANIVCFNLAIVAYATLCTSLNFQGCLP